MDFTVKTYRNLLESLIRQGYAFQTFAEFLEKPEPRSIILRHDVDLRPHYSLRFARIQHEAGVKGSYYFRMVPQSYDEAIIREIAALGHEIGYHYENMDTCKGNFEKALKDFARNLEQLRLLAPITTICMHGSPLSRYDNRDLWGKHQIPNSEFQTNSKKQIQNSQHTNPATRNPNPEPRNPKHYRDFGIIGEPYFDIDFSRVLYLTDTGRRWDGEKVSVRDKVGKEGLKFQIPNSKFQTNTKSQIQNNSITPNSKTLTQNSRLKTKDYNFHSTSDIIKATASHLLPDQIMFTFHPQRWTDKPLPWLKELVMQNVKNVGKRLLLRAKGTGRRA